MVTCATTAVGRGATVVIVTAGFDTRLNLAASRHRPPGNARRLLRLDSRASLCKSREIEARRTSSSTLVALIPKSIQGGVLGAVGIVQALLTALGAANGGFSAVLLNDRWLFFVGLVFVVIGFGVGAIHVQKTGRRGWLTKAVAGVATVCLLLGVLGTAYAAIAAPSLTSDPTVNISLTGGAHPLLRVSVTASGIPRSQTLQVEVGRLTIEANGLLHEVQPPLYHAELGANLQGEIATTISMPIPPPRLYSSINVEAWTGSVHHFCGFPTTTEPAVTIRPAHEGCALVQVAGA